MSRISYKIVMVSLAAISLLAIAPTASARIGHGYGGRHYNAVHNVGHYGGYYNRGIGAYGHGYIGNRWGYGHNLYGNRYFNRDYLFSRSRFFNNNRFFLGAPYNYYAPYTYYQYAMPYADTAAVVIVDNDDLNRILVIGNDSYLGDDYNNVVVWRVDNDAYGRFNDALRLRDFRDFRYDRLRHNLSFRSARGLWSTGGTILGY